MIKFNNRTPDGIHTGRYINQPGTLAKKTSDRDVTNYKSDTLFLPGKLRIRIRRQSDAKSLNINLIQQNAPAAGGSQIGSQ